MRVCPGSPGALPTDSARLRDMSRRSRKQ